MGVFVSFDTGALVTHISAEGLEWISGKPYEASLHLLSGGEVRGQVRSSFAMDRMLELLQIGWPDLARLLPWLEDPYFVPGEAEAARRKTLPLA